MSIKKCVWTLSVDDYAPEITRLTFPLLQGYADKIGAEFRIIDKRLSPDLPPVYEKLQIFYLGNQYDWNIFVDADALVHPDFFDPTDHMTPDTVAHNGTDLAGVRWRYDKYFRRDGRHIGSCNWFTVGSDQCLDLWHPLDDITFQEACSNIFPIQAELSGFVKRDHLIDDYLLSRNIARYGLKFTTIDKIIRDLGRTHGYLWHVYNTPESDKPAQMRTTLCAWGVSGFGVYVPPGIEGWMATCELQWLYEQARKMLSIVEIGSWKGRSTHALLSGCGGPVWAVDHFKGSPSERETTHTEASVKDIYVEFMVNVGHFSNLTVKRESSLDVASTIPDRSVDMVFIDGDHSFEGCLADIKAWQNKACILLCGHDRDQEGVSKALEAAGLSWKPGPGSIWFCKV